MASAVRDSDRGARALERALDELVADSKLTVGIHADTGAAEHRGPSRSTVVQVAAAQEFGDARRAPKSFLRATIDEKRSEIERMLANAAGRVLRGEDKKATLGAVASRVAELVRGRLRALGLVASGHLVESIEGRVAGTRVDAEPGEAV